MATLQPGVFYPPNLLLFVLPFDIAFNWIIVLHYWLAGIFTFFLLREVGAGRGGSLAGGITFMLSGYLLSVHNVLSALLSVAWTPIAILFFLRALKRGSLHYTVLTGITLAFMFTSGGIEILYGTMGCLFFIALMPDILTGEGRTITPQKSLLLLASSVVVFFLISAVQLLPFLELARHSTRAGGLSYAEATTWSMDLKDLFQFFIPDPYGYGVSNEKYWSNQSWLKTIYMGTVPFILSLFFFLERGRRALPFVFIILLSLALSMGRNTVLYQHLYEWVPFFDKMRYPVKFLFLAILFISISAGLGFDSLRNGLDEGRRRWRAAILSLLILSTIAAAVLGGLNYFDAEVKGFLIGRGYDYPRYGSVEINLFNTKRLLFFFILASVSIYGALRSARLRKALPFLIVAVLVVDLFFAHRGYYNTTRAAEYHKQGRIMEFVKKDPGIFRVFVTPRTMDEKVEEIVVPDEWPLKKGNLYFLNRFKERLAGYNIEHHIFNMDGMSVMARGDYNAVYDLLTIQKRPDSTNLLAMLNVKYVVSLPAIESAEFRLRKVIDNTGGLESDLGRKLKVYENLNYLPRFFTVGRFRVVEEPQEYMRIFKDKRFLPGEEVLLAEDPWGTEGMGIDAPEAGYKEPGEVKVNDYRNSSIELFVNMERPGILVASESYYPGWRVYVDGVERKLLRADLILRAVALGPGGHEVRFVYSPWSFRAGASISVLTLGVLFVLGLVSVGRKRKG
jgi:hypothetical protein